MNWLYTVSAASAPRLLMRVVLVFDQQQLTLSALDLRCDHDAGATHISIRVNCEESLARRIHAKLFHLNDIVNVRLDADRAVAPETATPPVESLSAFAPGGAYEAC